MRLQLPGPRPLRATLDGRDGVAVVVACPPHPRLGGDRTDRRLRAVSNGLPDTVDCLRFDYGPWDGGRGEQTDVRTALDWATESYDHVGLFGYSFGGGVALAALAPESGSAEAESKTTSAPDAVSVLAPAASVASERIAVALETVSCPVQVVYGERDTTADWEPVVKRASEFAHTTVAVSADHFFVGQQARVADIICTFLVESLDI